MTELLLAKSKEAKTGWSNSQGSTNLAIYSKEGKRLWLKTGCFANNDNNLQLPNNAFQFI
jgi:hypothetical protein